jgi:molybdopterin synthase catalytic subunit
VRAWITDAPIDTCELIQQTGSAEHGAVLLFLGTVRQINEGRPVTGIRYEAYREMAEQVLREIADEARARVQAGQINVVHRTGELGLGEVSVAIAVATPHRADAFDGARYIIEEIKKRLPIWKHEHYADGEAAWVKGQPPRIEATRE